MKREQEKDDGGDGLHFPHIDLSRNAGSSAVGFLYQHILQTVFTVIGLTGNVPSGFDGKGSDVDHTIVEGVEDLDVVMKDRCLHIQVKTSEWSTKEVEDTLIYACKFWARQSDVKRVFHEWHFWSLRAESEDLEKVNSLEKIKESVTEASEVHYRSSISLLLEALRRQASAGDKLRKKVPNQWAVAFLAKFKESGCGTYYEESPDVSYSKIKKLSPHESLKDIRNRLEKIKEAFDAWTFLTTCNTDALIFCVHQIPLWNEIKEQCIKMICEKWSCKEGVGRVLLSFLLAHSCDLLANSQHTRNSDSLIKSIPVPDSIDGRKMEVSKMKEELDLLSKKGVRQLEKEYASQLDYLEQLSMSMSLRERFYAEKYAGDNFVSYVHQFWDDKVARRRNKKLCNLVRRNHKAITIAITASNPFIMRLVARNSKIDSSRLTGETCTSKNR